MRCPHCGDEITGVLPADREALMADLLRIEEHSEHYTCGDGCCDDWDYPLAEEAVRLREAFTLLLAARDQSRHYLTWGGTANAAALRASLDATEEAGL